MTDNYLSINQITELREKLKNDPENSYRNIGVMIDGTNVEIFIPENYNNLLTLFLNSPELNTLSDEATKVKQAVVKMLNDLEKTSASINLKVGKLCSAFILAKTKNLIPNWFFYYVPKEFYDRNLTRYQIIQSGTATPINLPTPLSPIPFAKTIQSSSSSYDRVKGKKKEVSYPHKPTFVNNPSKPLFTNIASIINTREASIPSQFSTFVAKPYDSEFYTAKKSELISVIRQAFELKPKFKIICDRKNGMLSIQNIAEDEDFDTQGFCYCPIHSGNNLSNMETISEELRSKITGCYGYLTGDSRCFDSCHKSGSSNINSEESKEIEDQKNAINDILTVVDSNIKESIILNKNHKDLVNERFISEQNLHVSSVNLISNFGENADRNIHHLQSIINDPLLDKVRVESRMGRVLNVSYKYMELPITNHTFMSSFFDREGDVISKVDQVNIKLSLYGIDIEIPKNIETQIVNLLPDVKDNVQNQTVELFKIGNSIHMKFNSINISFQLSIKDSILLIKHLELPNINSFETGFHSVTISSKYKIGTYRHTIYNIGKKYSKILNIESLLENRYNTLMLIGSCYLSEYSDLLSNFINSNEDTGTSHKYQIINSLANKFQLPVGEIQRLIDNLTIAIESNEDIIEVNLSDDYSLRIDNKVSKSILKELNSLPTIENGYVHLNNHKIKIEELDNFLNGLQSAISDLSNRAKNYSSIDLLVVPKVTKIDTIKGWKNHSIREEIEGPKEIEEELRENQDNENKYFDEIIKVQDIEMTGFEAKALIDKYFNLLKYNLSSGSVEISLNRIPLISHNFIYLLSQFFGDNEDIINSMVDEEGNIISRSYVLVMILFSNVVSELILPNGNTINLKSILQKLNPYLNHKKYESTISKTEAVKAKILYKYMGYMESIDLIALQSLDIMINKFGNELLELIFTGYQMKIDGKITNLCFQNRKEVIPAAQEIYNRRRLLRNQYINKIRPFLETIYNQDSISSEIPLYYSNVGDYIVYLKSGDYINKPQLVIPSNPFYATHKSDESENLFLEEFSIYVPVEFQTDKLDTVIVDDNFITNMNLLFPGSNTITLSMLTDRYVDILKNGKFKDQLVILSLIIKFGDIISLFLREFDNEKKEEIYKMLDLSDKLFNAIINGELANKIKDGLPSISNLDSFISNIRDTLNSVLDFNFIIQGNEINFSKLLEFFISNFKNIIGLFNPRRMTMRQYVMAFVSNFYDVRYNNNQIVETRKFPSFETQDQNIGKNGEIFYLSPDKIDIIELALEKCLLMIEGFSILNIDPNIRTPPGIPSLDIIQRYNIFKRFSDLLINSESVSEFDIILRSISYYLYSNLDRNYYNIYVKSNYSNILNSISSNTLNMFKEVQDKFHNDLLLMTPEREKKNSADINLKNIKKKIEYTEDNILSKKGDLITNFVEFVSVIDIIVKSYENKKQSYGTDDSEFKDLIENIKLRVETIKIQFSKIEDIDMKIILSIFSENFDLYNIRKTIYRELGFNENSSGIFYSIIESAIGIVKLNAKTSRENQIKNLNEYLSPYNLTILSSVNDVQNSIRVLPLGEQDKIKREYGKCKFANKILELMNNEINVVHNRLFNNKIDQIEIPKRDDRPKFDNFGIELNQGLSNYNVDQFTHQELKILGKNISRFIELFNNTLRVIDCGPGMHLLSDAIETFLNYINNTNNSNSFDTFVKAMKSFIKFNNDIGKSIQDIIQSSEFKMFVSIINGKFNEFDNVLLSINFFNELPATFNVYDGVTTNFFRGVLLSFEEIVNEGIQIDMDIIFEKFSTHCENKFNYDNLQIFINNLTDLNNGIVTFIDEYVDENHNILNPLQVVDLQSKYNLKTLSPFMKPIFRKLNQCIIMYIRKQDEDFKFRIIERFTTYVELFSNKFKSIKTLESYMIKR